MTRVLLTDAEERSVLAACRGLHQASFRVCAVASRRPAATHWSRCCSERHTAPDPRRDVAGYVDRLEGLLKRTTCGVLLPGTDASLLAISEHRDRFASLTKLGLPSRAQVRQVMERGFVYRQAALVDLPPPASVSCERPQDARLAAREVGFPVIVKPARSLVASDGAMRQQRSRVAMDDAALANVLGAFVGPCIVQRYVAGSTVFSCAGVIAEQRLLALAVSRYLRTWPPEAGSAALSETVSPPPSLPARVEALLNALGWRGIFEVELLARADGAFSLIDLNPRPYGSLSLAIAAGANLPAVWCQYLLGRDPVPVVARPGMRYRWEEGELLHLLSLFRHRRWGDAAAVLRPYGAVTHAHFRLADPAPLAARGIYLAGRLLNGSRSGARGTSEAMP